MRYWVVWADASRVKHRVECKSRREARSMANVFMRNRISAWVELDDYRKRGRA